MLALQTLHGYKRTRVQDNHGLKETDSHGLLRRGDFYVLVAAVVSRRLNATGAHGLLHSAGTVCAHRCCCIADRFSMRLALLLVSDSGLCFTCFVVCRGRLARGLSRPPDMERSEPWSRPRLRSPLCSRSWAKPPPYSQDMVLWSVLSVGLSPLCGVLSVLGLRPHG